MGKSLTWTWMLFSDSFAKCWCAGKHWERGNNIFGNGNGLRIWKALAFAVLQIPEIDIRFKKIFLWEKKQTLYLAVFNLTQSFILPCRRNLRHSIAECLIEITIIYNNNTTVASGDEPFHRCDSPKIPGFFKSLFIFFLTFLHIARVPVICSFVIIISNRSVFLSAYCSCLLPWLYPRSANNKNTFLLPRQFVPNAIFIYHLMNIP